MTYRKFPALLRLVLLAALALSVFPSAGISNPFKPKQSKKDKPPEKSPLDRYIEEAMRNSPNSSALETCASARAASASAAAPE